MKLDELLHDVLKPARYTGGEWNQVARTGERPKCRMALCYPDVYEVGMSHLGSRILYHLVNLRPDASCERAFLPWPDAAALLCERGRPLKSLETKTPLCDLDLVGITLQHELNYPGIVRLLELGHIPVRAVERDERHPIVLGGGPCAAAPEPVAPFFDALVIGDGEDALNEVLDVYVRHTEGRGLGSRASREALLEALAQVLGVYVPSLYEATDGRPKPRTVSAPGTVRRRIVPSLEDAPFPERPVVPFVEIVHDRAQIEINRGCSHGCRFCQAGILYRPVRQRSLPKLLEQARAALKSTGYEEISLSSLSCTDYPRIVELADAILDEFGEEHLSLSLPSLRTDQFGVELAQRVSTGRKSAVTLAPEAGSQRLRNVINKNVTEENLREAATAAFRAGWHSLKLYFMIGLPTETDEDILAIAETVRGIESLGESLLGSRRGRLRVAATVSGFVPKPHSVFEGERQCSREELQRKHGLLRQALHSRYVQLKLNSPDQTALEGIVARGGRWLAEVIEQVAHTGEGLESWHEWFSIARWEAALARHGTTVDAEVSRGVDEGREAPWGHIDVGVSPEFRAREAAKARECLTTPDCREGGCQACGLEDCCEQVAAAYGQPAPREAPKRGGRPALGGGRGGEAPAAWRAIIVFGKEEGARFLAHLDITRAIQRAARRAGLPMAYSQGFHERPRMTIARPLPVGVTGSNELCSFELTEPWSAKDVARSLAREMPQGLSFRSAAVEPRGRRSPFEGITRAVYRVDLVGANADGVSAALTRLLALREIPITRTTKSGERLVDIRPGILGAGLEGVEAALCLELACSDLSLVKPEEFVAALNRGLAERGEAEVVAERVHRVHLLGEATGSRGALGPSL